MKLISGDFLNNQFIPARFTCDAENINPSFNIFDAPKNTISLALIADDPDASGGGWVHWLLWNIDPITEVIERDSVPAGAIEGTTSFGTTGYGGPCPPQNTHRYFFTLYALDNTLDLKPEAGKKELMEAMAGHILDQTDLVGLYQRG